MKVSWIPALLLLLASPSQGSQVYSHDAAGVRWEAEVTQDQFVLRERKRGAPAGTEFICPLGPAVRATTGPGTAGAGKLCLVFSKDKCFSRGADIMAGSPPAQRPGAAPFKCFELATTEHANAVAGLVNARAQAHAHGGPARLSAETKNASAAPPGDPRATAAGATPQKDASATARPPVRSGSVLQ